MSSLNHFWGGFLVSRVHSWAALGLAASVFSCGGNSATPKEGPKPAPPQPEKAILSEPSALQKRLAAMAPATVLPASDEQKKREAKVDAYFQARPQKRLFVHTDKPLYKPGETVWFRTWQLAAPTLVSSAERGSLYVQLKLNLAP